MNRTLSLLYAPDLVGTEAHLDRLDSLRAAGDVVELDPEGSRSARPTFIALTHDAVSSLASSPALTSRFGTGLVDAPEARDHGDGDGVDVGDGVPFRALNTSDGAPHRTLGAALGPLGSVDVGAVTRATRAAQAELEHGHLAPLAPLAPLALENKSRRSPLHPADPSLLVDAVSLAMRSQAAAVGPRFGVDDATLTRGIALAHRTAFAWHDEPETARAAFAEVDAELVALARASLSSSSGAAPGTVIHAIADAVDAGAVSVDDAAWLVRFAFLTAFVTTELAAAHMLALLADDDVVTRLRDEPALRSRFIEESLRVQAPVARFGRVAAADVAIGDARIPKGARVILSFAAACHDPRRYPQPRVVDAERPRGSPSLAFGAGAHACLGAGTAHAILRAILDVAIEHAPFTVVESEPLRSPVNRGRRRLLLRRAR